ncbi:MAG: peptide-methionine (S)-S-oxide reductase MsrA, partial [Flavobacteriales bacterium]
FGAGCFWCVEAIFQDIKGVTKVESGYTGGHVKNPAYREVCNGTTGHAEVVQLTYNPDVVSYETLLEAFWLSHDPTTLNRQGADVGTQYRSAVFYHNEEQGKLAKDFKKRLNDEKAFGKPVVTEISAATEFYAAEEYHQDYFENNPTNSYCRMVVGPKLEKFRKVFKQPVVN